METEKDNNKDPFADIRNLLYSQRPESRETEIRAEKNKAKATVFLQAFGTIADAFTLNRGGDVPKRDLNPYIMNNTQKAEGMREQDRADKKGWENSLLNLQNQVAQYNIKQEEWEKQKAYQDERDKIAREHQEKMTLQAQGHQEKVANDNYDRTVGLHNLEHGNRWKLAEQQHGHNLETIGVQHKNNMSLARLRLESAEKVAAIKSASRQTLSALRQTSKMPGFKEFIKIPDPENPSLLVPIDESVALRLWNYMLSSEDENIKPHGKRGGKPFTKDEIKTHVIGVATKHPEAVIEYLGDLYGVIFGDGTVGTNETVGTNSVSPYGAYNPWQMPQRMPQGQGPIDYHNPANTMDDVL
jgi:hypothetical protein